MWGSSGGGAGGGTTGCAEGTSLLWVCHPQLLWWEGPLCPLGSGPGAPRGSQVERTKGAEPPGRFSGQLLVEHQTLSR